MIPRRLCLTETREGLKIEFTFAYEGSKAPTAPQRRKRLINYLREAADYVEKNKPVDIGQAEGQEKRFRLYRDDLLVEEKGAK